MKGLTDGPNGRPARMPRCGDAVVMKDTGSRPATRPALAALGRALESELGAPQDIEWTRCGDRLILLQSRPITQTMPSGRRLLWDNANIIEIIEGRTKGIFDTLDSVCKVRGLPPAPALHPPPR